MKKYFALFFVLISLAARGQSDGPRAHLPSPTGVWAINVKYMSMQQNVLPSGNLQLKNATIDVDVLPITLIHTFAVGKSWARVLVMAAPITSFNARLNDSAIPINQIQKSGFSDGWVTFEVGIKGNPAKNIVEFSKTEPPKFSMNGQFRLWYSGSYDEDNLVNLGSNRTTFDIGLPMQLRLNTDVKKALWLETWPGVQFYTANNDPAKASLANQITQKPMLYLENHLSYSFSPKFYAGVDLRIQQGGQTLSDGEEDGNRLSLLAGGIFAGYKPLPFLDFYANYAGILAGENDVESEMIRLSLVFSYVNMKKYRVE